MEYPDRSLLWEPAGVMELDFVRLAQPRWLNREWTLIRFWGNIFRMPRSRGSMSADRNEHNWYSHGLAARCRILADAGFVRDPSRIWRHADGRAIGESVMLALVDPAFIRFAGVEPSVISPQATRKSRGTRKSRKEK